MASSPEKETIKETTKDLEEENVLDLTIEYLLKGQWHPGLSKNKKRSIRKKAASIVVEAGEVFLKKKVMKLWTILS